MKNNSFKNAFRAELYKLIDKKSLIKLLIAIVIIFLVFTLVFNFMQTILSEYGTVPADSSSTTGATTSEKLQYAKEMLDSYKEQISEMPSDAYRPLLDTTLYKLKVQVAIYGYLDANNLSDSSVNCFGCIDMVSANGYIKFMLQIMAMVIVIYAMVCAYKTMAVEIGNGTMKMQLLRPINRDSFLAAKYCAVLVFTTFLLFGVLVFTSIISVIMFNIDARDVILTINASKAFIVSPVIEILIYFVYYVFFIFSYIQLTIFFSNFSREKSGIALAIPLVVFLLGSTVEKYLGYLYIGYAGFSANVEWISALTTEGPILNYMSIYSMIGISLLWIAGLTIGSHLLFRNKDIQN